MTTPGPVRPRGPAPTQCPQCLGHGEAVVYTLVLGWECSGCRIARQWAPGKILFGQAAVDARRAANRVGAAGPALLEALRACVTSLRTFRNVPKDEQEWTPLDDEALRAGFQAIAQAEGRTP